MTKIHTDYLTFSPLDTWDVCPRVMTYVKKSRNLHPVQIRPTSTADICWIKISGASPPIFIANIYRRPQEVTGGTVITALKEWEIPPNILIAGDFNTRHTNWDSQAGSSRRAEEVTEWAQHNSLLLISPVDEGTHSRGSVLDSVFTNILGAQFTIEKHLHTTSDHETLVSIIPLNSHENAAPR